MYDNILVPVSFDTERDSAGALAVAKHLASENGKIALLHVVEQVPSYVLSALPSEYQADARETAGKELADMAATLPNASAHVIAGHAGRTVLDWAEKNQPDCIVIAGHRPGMQDLLLGSTATQVVRHANCAVHVIR